jgi:DNA gyrase subunit B
MGELISRGHVYIAQPPLFKIKQGKQERYLKDENELQEFLLEAALTDAVLFAAGGQEVKGTELANLCRSYLAVEQTIKRLSRRYDADALRRLIYMPRITSELLKNKKQAEKIVQDLQSRLSTDAGHRSRYEVTLGIDTRNNLNEISVLRHEHGTATRTKIDAEFVSSGEYASMQALGERLEKYFTAEATIQRADKNHKVMNINDMLEWLMAEARRGQTIQRYKGLGEMNPEQLWETTMDISARRLLKVNVDDAVAADEVFTMLMGDQVEPRREFIEKNALDVSNLDV